MLILALAVGADFAKAIGGPDFDWATWIVNNQGFVILGETHSFGQGKSDIIFLKVDSSGTLEQARVFGYDGEDYARAVIALSDGGYLIAGEIYDYAPSGRDILLLRLDSLCEPVWARSYAGHDWEWAEGAAMCPEMGCVLVGMTTSSGAGQSDIAIIRTDSTGNILWARTYGGPGSEWGVGVVVDPEGNILVVGNSTEGILVLSLSQAGALMWARLLISEPPSLALSCSADHQGNLAVLGDAGSEVILIKMSPRGDLIWARHMGTAEDDRPISLAIDRVGRITVVASAVESNEALLATFSEDGEPIWARACICPGLIWGGDLMPCGEDRWVIAVGMSSMYADDILILSVSGGNTWPDWLHTGPATLSVEAHAGVLLSWFPKTRDQDLVDMTPKLSVRDVWDSVRFR